MHLVSLLLLDTSILKFLLLVRTAAVTATLTLTLIAIRISATLHNTILLYMQTLSSSLRSIYTYLHTHII